MAINKSSDVYSKIQSAYRAKFLKLQKQLEKEFSKIADEFDGKIQRLVFKYSKPDGTFDKRLLTEINREIDTIAYWFTQTSADWINKNLIESAELAIDSMDMAAKAFIRAAAEEYQGKGKEILIKAATDPAAPFLLRVQYGTGLAKNIRDAVWKRRWVDGWALSDRIWKTDRVLRKNLHDMIEQCVNEGLSAVEFSRAVEQYLLKPGPAWTTKITPSVTGRGSIKYNALRLARTETNNAYRLAHALGAQNSSIVKGIKWNLSHSHPEPDICDEWATQDLYGLGPGVYPPDKLPPGHPNCLCYLTDILLQGEDLVRALEEKYQTSIPAGIDGSKVGLSKIDRTNIIDSIMSSEAISKFDDVHKALIKADLEKASDINIQIVEKSIRNLHLNLNGTETCFYRPNTGYLEMNMNKDPVENIRTFWHEYGHYIDDVRYGNGLKLSTIIGDDKYSFEALGVSSRADLLHKYDSKVGSDIQGFLDEISPGKYEVRGDNYVNIYLKGTDIQVGEQWGTNFKDFSTLMDEINEGLKDKLGAYDSEKYLRSLGKPQSPEWSDYFIQYRTPKRQTLKTKPAFKGAEEAWHDAVQKYSEELTLWEKANPNASAEASKLYDAYLDRKERFGAIADLIDGETRGELGMRVLWGGHDPTYYKTNDRHINEGWANWFQLTFQNDVEMLEYLEHYAPEAKRIFEECYQEMVKQTFGR